MSSRGYIAIQDDEGWITKIFLNHEAYPYTNWSPFEGAGEVLMTHYQDPDKIRRLIHRQHPPAEPPQPPTTIEYTGYDLDKLEPDLDLCEYADYPTSIREVQDLDELLEEAEDDVFTEHLYLYINEGWWMYRGPNPETGLQPLSFVIAQQAAREPKKP